MFKLKITREVYNEKGVFGKLTIEKPDGFVEVFTTVERKQCPDNWIKLTPTQRIRYCIPSGIYSVKYMYDRSMEPYFYIQGVSTWKPVLFTESNENKANTIKVGYTATPDGDVRGTAMRDLSKILKEYMMYGFIPYTPKYGLFSLNIMNSPDYHEGDFVP